MPRVNRRGSVKRNLTPSSAKSQFTLIDSTAVFGPSAVRVKTATVYSERCEAGVVMTSVNGMVRRRSLEVVGSGARRRLVKLHVLGIDLGIGDPQSRPNLRRRFCEKAPAVSYPVSLT